MFLSMTSGRDNLKQIIWHDALSPIWVLDKGEMITRVNGNFSFIAGKRLQNSYICKPSPLIITCKWECIIVN